MRLHNTLTRQTEEFKPIKPNSVSLYTCGPTVYSYYHIGNLRNAVFNDTLRRTLEANGYNVKHVMNITDVGHLDSDADDGEDKLEAGAKKDNKSVWEVAKFYTEAFEADMASLNVLPPNGYSGPGKPYAKATDFIPQQIELVKILIEKGFAYQTDEAIYFDVSKLPSYGELSGQKLSEKEVGAREEVVKDAEKRNPQDFALWFFTVGRFAGHSMHWPTPWGEGFPGWHLECSAIIHSTLGDPIDIHTGGVDHIGTHHPNEMAQTEAAFGHKLANYWVHNEHILVDGKKMSKSLGNFYTLTDVKAEGYQSSALRLLYLQSHYRTQSNFSWDSLDAAQIVLKNFFVWSDLQHQNHESAKLKANYAEAIKAIKTQLSDDLNTPAALAIVNGMINRVEEFGPDSVAIKHAAQEIDKLLGLDISKVRDINQEQKDLLEQRGAARNSKDWSKSDQLRDELDKAGVAVNDTEYGQLWFRK